MTQTVSRSLEWRRVDALPRLTPFAIDLTNLHRKACGEQVLRPVQSWALANLDIGLFGAIGVGKGKTLISLLAPKILKSKRPLLLLPAKLISKTEQEYLGYQQHWDCTLPVLMSYERLGRVKEAGFLERYTPDLIIADECHRLKNQRAAVTRRVVRYARLHNTKCIFLSGTITRRSLHDYWHLIALALGVPNMPLPRGWPELEDWALALDSNVEAHMRVHPGPLCEWGPADEPDPLTRARLGYQRRLAETPGVVCTQDDTAPAGLDIAWMRLPPPPVVVSALKELERTWAFDGWEYADALSLHRARRQLALGFHYRWKVRPPAGWLDARSAWVRFVREKISRGSKYDSEFQVAQAFRDDTTYRLWCDAKAAFIPETEARWLSPFAVDACARWLQDDNPGLVWVDHLAFGAALQKAARVLFHNTGTALPMHPFPAVLSIRAFSEGLNLQAWNRNLIASCPSTGAAIEQLIGRTHRDGQEADEVTVDILNTDQIHEQSYRSALDSAAYLQLTLGQKQKILLTKIRG